MNHDFRFRPLIILAIIKINKERWKKTTNNINNTHHPTNKCPTTVEQMLCCLLAFAYFFIASIFRRCLANTKPLTTTRSLARSRRETLYQVDFRSNVIIRKWGGRIKLIVFSDKKINNNNNLFVLIFRWALASFLVHCVYNFFFFLVFVNECRRKFGPARTYRITKW